MPHCPSCPPSWQSALIPTSFINALTAYDTYYQSMSSNFSTFTTEQWHCGAARWPVTSGARSTTVRLVCITNSAPAPVIACVLDYNQVALSWNNSSRQLLDPVPELHRYGRECYGQVTLVNATLANDGVRPLQAAAECDGGIAGDRERAIGNSATADLNDVI